MHSEHSNKKTELDERITKQNSILPRLFFSGIFRKTSEQDKEQTENPSNLLCQSNPDSLLEMGFTKIPKSSILDQEEDKYI